MPFHLSTAALASFTMHSKSCLSRVVIPVSRLVSIVQPLLWEVFSESGGHYFLHYFGKLCEVAHLAVVLQHVFIK